MIYHSKTPLNLKLNELRRADNKTLKEMAAIVGVNISTYGKYEKGKLHLPEMRLIKLCKYYTITLHDFYEMEIEAVYDWYKNGKRMRLIFERENIQFTV
ncbi:MAG: helix-turn-helix transcriptional regulator [Bacteroidota bacterium]